jgi:predicted metal-dependent peptidase
MALIMSQPFFGALALRLRLHEHVGCGTAYTDGQVLGYDPDFVRRLTDGELKGLVAHEVMHCAAGHVWRKGSRQHLKWNAACDFAINPIVFDAGLQLPYGALVNASWRGMSAEEIYTRLPNPPSGDAGGGEGNNGDSGGEWNNGDSGGEWNNGDSGGEGNNGDSGGEWNNGDSGGEGNNGDSGGDINWNAALNGEVRTAANTDEAVEQQQRWKQAVVQAAQVAKMAGRLPLGIEQFVGNLTEPKVDWKNALRRFVQQLARADYTWRMPNKRFTPLGMYLPALHSENMPPIVVAFDTSGSCWHYQQRFFAELKSVIDECKPESVWFLQCDASIESAEELMAGDQINPTAKGGGGTSFVPPFEWVAEQGIQPACMIYMTDTYGTFPEQAPEYPVLWAVTEKGVQVPFGEVIYVGD